MACCPVSLDSYGQNHDNSRLFSNRIPRGTAVANTVQAKKRARQAEAHRARNTAQRSAMRTQIKKVLKAVETKDKAGAQLAFRDAAAALDSSAKKGLVHKNNAARQKSQLNKRVRALA
jgi:small subunit ribosomal protein S20